MSLNEDADKLSELRQDAANALGVAINLTHHARHIAPPMGQETAEGHANLARIGYLNAVATYTMACVQVAVSTTGLDLGMGQTLAGPS